MLDVIDEIRSGYRGGMVDTDAAIRAAYASVKDVDGAMRVFWRSMSQLEDMGEIEYDPEDDVYMVRK